MTPPPSTPYPPCPLCGGALDSGVCGRCRAWWARGLSPEPVAPGPPPEGQLLLRVGISWFALGFFVAVGGLAGVAVFSTIGALRSPAAHLLQVPALLFSLWVGLVCLAALAAEALHALAPTRLHLSGSELGLRCWNTWGSMLAGFRRSDLHLPRPDVRGFAFSLSQGGATQLFAVHNSGLALYLGWSGPRAEAERHAAALQAWLAGPAEP